MSEVTPKRALEILASGRVPTQLEVGGSLELKPAHPLSLPQELSAVALSARWCQWLTALPDTLSLRGRLDVAGCTNLTALSRMLRATSIAMAGCTAIETLPEDLDISFLDATGCTAFSRWPARGRFSHGHLLLRNCTALRSLPAWIESVAQLDIAGCSGITELPQGLRVTSFIDLADSAVARLPASLQGVQLRWRGVPIDERIAFQPETISAHEILGEQNIELRRAKLGRMGYERFLREAAAQPIDADHDRGGARQLFRVNLEEDEPLVCLSVICPSTGRRYVLRVPPDTTRCHGAAAWIAGFDDPALYAPELET